jgi:hypothetical protein
MKREANVLPFSVENDTQRQNFLKKNKVKNIG